MKKSELSKENEKLKKALKIANTFLAKVLADSDSMASEAMGVSGKMYELIGKI